MSSHSLKDPPATAGTTKALPLPLLVQFWMIASPLIGVWYAVGYHFPRELASDQAQRGQLGDQFGAVNSLFTGLALAGLFLTFQQAQRAHSVEKAQAEAQLRLAKEQLRASAGAMNADHFARAVTAIATHAQQFAESSHYRLARSVGWRCIQRAFDDSQFRTCLAAAHRALRAPGEESISGWFRDENLARDGREAAHVYSWLDASLLVNDLISFFSVLAGLVEDARTLASRSETPEDDFRKLQGVVLGCNLSWDWWGPALGYVVRLRQQQDARHFKDTDYSTYIQEKFAILDRELFEDRVKTSFRFLDSPEPASGVDLPDAITEYMAALYSHEPTFSTCQASGKSIADNFSTPVIPMRIWKGLDGIGVRPIAPR